MFPNHWIFAFVQGHLNSRFCPIELLCKAGKWLLLNTVPVQTYGGKAVKNFKPLLDTDNDPSLEHLYS